MGHGDVRRTRQTSGWDQPTFIFRSRAVSLPVGTRRAPTTHLHGHLISEQACSYPSVELSGQGVCSSDFLHRTTLN